MDPPMTASARLGLVRLARRTPPPSLGLLTGLMGQRLVDVGPKAAPKEGMGRKLGAAGSRGDGVHSSVPRR
jgi:hypothetical protein